MKNIRIGNDIKIVWDILYEGEPLFLAGKDVTVYLSCQYDRIKVKGFSVSGNTISWTFYGKDQKNTGKYSLELVLNEGKEGMISVDARKVLNLVPHSCDDDETDVPNVTLEYLDLNTEVGFISGNTATPNWNASENEEGFIQNRTHYRKFGSWSDISISGGIANINGITDYEYISLNNETVRLDENKRYNVTFDGVGLVQITVIPASDTIKVVAANGSISKNFINENIRPFNVVPLGMEFLPKGLATEEYVNEKIAEIEVSGGGTTTKSDFNSDFSKDF